MDDLSEFTFSVPASAQAFTDICEFMDTYNIKEPLVKVVSCALYDWMAAQKAARDLAVATELRGYQWKQVFLPDGTRLRTVVNGEHIIARVDGCSLVYGGNRVSPAQFVNLAHGFRCNAWRRTWLLLPGQAEWQLAGSLRIGTQRGPNSSEKESHRVQKSRKELKRVVP
jgi:hypothetical protein